jgi:hypothetical protein
MSTKKVPKVPEIFECKVCDYITSRKSQFERHVLTAKHLKSTDCQQKSSETTNECFECICGKAYKERTGLWRHKKKCLVDMKKIIEDKAEYFNEVAAKKERKCEDSDEKIDHEELIKILMKQNTEFKTMLIDQNHKIMELAKDGKYITNNNTTTNNNFNLNFFLNEKCKDAINIMDFINQLQLKLTDLDMVGRIGYAEGISKIFIRGLKELDVCKRPIHCSDIKREVLYVKDKDAWEKDNDEKAKLKLAIKQIGAKNVKNLPAWIEENPESVDIDTKKHMDYHNIIINAMGGSSNDEDEKIYSKIIKSVAQEVVIDKIGT